MKTITIFSKSTRSFNKRVRASAAFACKSWLILICFFFFLGATSANAGLRTYTHSGGGWSVDITDGIATLMSPMTPPSPPNGWMGRDVSVLEFPTEVVVDGVTYPIHRISLNLSVASKAAITNVTIPEHITFVGRYSFSNFTAIT